MASRLFHQIKTYFPDLSEAQFDQDYDVYLTQILAASNDRRAFDLASMALVATLHDGHSWFYDAWLDENHGQSVGLTVYRLDQRWVVMRSRLASVSEGDVVTAIDGTPADDYFNNVRKYISASSERDAMVSLFDTPALFPDRFTITLESDRRVVIDRKGDKKGAEPPLVSGRWLIPGRVGYIKLAAFHGIETVAAAWQYFNEFHGASAVILDLRGNIGGGDPRGLQQGLMSTPYPMWSETGALTGGELLRGYGVAHPGMTHVTVTGADIRPRGPAYTGRLFLLVDRGCTCACEDFTMPFKVTGRAQLIGETTAGTFSFTHSTQYENGMRLNIAAVRHTFPDGSRFEGIGIKPDVEVVVTPRDLKSGHDVVLERALALASRG
jgi:carboxyl-terminal processing protease